MKRSALAVAMAVIVVGCGQKADDTKNALNAVAAAAGASDEIEAGMQEAEQFQKERVAKGDTVAMPYAELQKFLPASVDGYTPREEPSGQSQAMPGFSMSQAEQTWVAEAGADGNTPEVQITLIDFGGTQQGYAMMAAPLMMNFSQEDAHRRIGSVKIDVPHSAGWEEFDKDTKSTKLTAITRYRYVITVEARDRGEDQSAMAKALAEAIAKKFEGK